jgi:hypothetical protein
MRSSHSWHDIDSPEPTARLNGCIEIPRGRRKNYELAEKTVFLRFDRLLCSAVRRAVAVAAVLGFAVMPAPIDTPSSRYSGLPVDGRVMADRVAASTDRGPVEQGSGDGPASLRAARVQPVDSIEAAPGLGGVPGRDGNGAGTRSVVRTARSRRAELKAIVESAGRNATRRRAQERVLLAVLTGMRESLLCESAIPSIGPPSPLRSI